MQLIYPIYDYYLAIYQNIEASLKLSLNKLNLLINHIQSSAFLHLLESDENQLSVEELRQQFEGINKIINEWIVPTINYLNASMDLFSYKTNSSVNQRNKVQFCGVGVNLFNTKQKIFDTFAEKLRLIREEQKQTQEPLEIVVKEEESVPEKVEESKGKGLDAEPEPEVSSSKEQSYQVVTAPKDREIFKKRESKSSQSSLSTSTPNQELRERVQDILKGTTQKILSDLNELIKEHHALKELMFGKGSHMKLYINRHLVLIPKHRTLKRGTATNIQKSIVVALEKPL